MSSRTCSFLSFFKSFWRWCLFFTSPRRSANIEPATRFAYVTINRYINLRRNLLILNDRSRSGMPLLRNCIAALRRNNFGNSVGALILAVKKKRLRMDAA
uniref:Secreted protein n=1 Tax=Phlegmariurus squarrosus TaxID=73615 RepID=H9M874_PHLSQ|nr:hypothetical protein HusqMp99 [Phlegmariurus squarrosus]AEV55781.1 hypothetical protein HusqMp99 [Phlegmariurus squarrosus]